MKRRKFLAADLALPTGMTISVMNKVFNQANPAIVNKEKYKSIKTGVLVVGGGPAGIGAGIDAAKSGAETLLIENYGLFGGVASQCVGMVINQMRPEGNPRGPRGYIHELLFEKLNNYDSQTVKVSTHNYLVHLKAVGTITEGNRIQMIEAMRNYGGGKLKNSEIVGVGTQTADGVDLTKGGESQSSKMAM